ncbi:uncharacterized protein LOC126395316 [Epinephelus moara]|uniref:uncharacterized protein LOC126395316 n=1 Tax=Epinephelus moara TaxID=300413 RepID=UPI00214E1FD1|nr:uncharacterized protein LOC126395316 [Epinephelus moara]
MKMYQENVLYRESVKARKVSKYTENIQHRQRVKAISKAKSIAKYRESIEHREKVKAISKAKSIKKYRESIEHREKVKASCKAKSIAKYRESIKHREKVKALSVNKYGEDTQHRQRVKMMSVIKYRQDTQHRQRVKMMSVSKYRERVEHRERVMDSVRLSRKQRMEKSVDFGFVMEQFLEKVRDGPDFVCCVCHRLLFRNQVQSCVREVYGTSLATAGIAEQCISEKYLHRCNDQCVVPCQLVLSRGQLWICHTCHRKISAGEMPAECWSNNLDVDPVPPELGCLNSIEQHLIALHIPFMKMLALPKGGKNGVHGPVTCVPANITQTSNVLPRSSMEGSLVQVKLKRKLTYKGHYEYQFVDPLHVRQALEYLKRTNVHYRDTEFNEEWINEFCRQEDGDREEAGSASEDEAGRGSEEAGTGSEVVGQVVEKAEVDDLAESADIVQDEMLHDRQQHCMFQDTCLMPADIGQEALDQYFDDIVNIAPAEGNSPVRMLSDQSNEAKCFPVLFPVGQKTFHDSQRYQLSLSCYFNNRIMHCDGRFARNVEYIFLLSTCQRLIR